MRKLLCSFILIGIFSMMISAISCSNPEYKLYAFKKGINFSFEYPSHYKIKTVYAYSKDKGIGGVRFWDQLPSDWYWTDTLYVIVEDKSLSAQEAITDIESNLLEKEILEKETITMAGMQGEMLVYSYKASLPSAPPGGIGCSPRKIPAVEDPDKIRRIVRTAYFSNGKQLWSMEIGTSESKAEQFKADFEHILQTFKILN
jgi:hypothetical protein